MVRAIVGTLLEIGKGRMTLDEFRAVIERKDRCEAGTSVPAHALFLEEVEYGWDSPAGNGENVVSECGGWNRSQPVNFSTAAHLQRQKTPFPAGESISKS
jgi:hypothetical protein